MNDDTYRDPSRSPLERAEALLALMTVEEKAQQLTAVLPSMIKNRDGLDPQALRQHLSLGIGQISAISLGTDSALEVAKISNGVQAFLRNHTRLGIPALSHTEALNGVMAAEFTSFPTAIGLAATWDTDAVAQMADTIRQQLVSVGVRQALSPVLDIARDSRWGRVHETFGEEVALVSAMGVAYVAALQGDDPLTGVVATAKHFLGYATTEGGQNTSATRVGPRELYDVFATPFEAAIREAGLASIMNSYSEVDGEPVVHSRALMTDLLRGRLGFTGTVVSDYRSIQYAVDRHGAAPDAQTSAARSLYAGLDVELPVTYGYGQALVDPVREGLVPMADLDQAVLRVLTQKFELGLFEQPFVSEDPSTITSSTIEGRELSETLARNSLTLLTNNGILPVTSTTLRVAVIGPHASNVLGSFANYTYPPMLEMIKGIATGRSKTAGMETVRDELPPTLRDAFDRQVEEMASRDPEEMVRDMYGYSGLVETLQAAAPGWDIVSAPGSGVVDALDGGYDEAIDLARSADLVILALGGRSGAFAGSSTEGEGTDSAGMNLPAAQLGLVDAVTGTGVPSVAVVTMGRPYLLGEIAEKTSAVLAAFYPGPAAATAIAEILTGARSPSGRLPFTVPRSVGQVPVYQAQKRGSGYRRLEKDIFKGYIDSPSDPLFHFGHGLSYTSFEYENLRIAADEVPTSGAAELSLRVRNTGTTPAAEVVQVYLSLPAVGVTRPAQQLVAFARADIAPGAAVEVSVQVPMAMCGYSVTADEHVVDPGQVSVLVGSSSHDIRLRGEFTIVGDRRPLTSDRQYIATTSTVPVT